MHIINNNDFKINKLYCNIFLKKNGKVIFIKDLYDSYLCILNNKIKIQYTLFPLLNYTNNNEIFKKLIILYLIQKKDFKYIKIKFIFDKKIINKDYGIYLFDKNNINNTLFIIFLLKINYGYNIFDKNKYYDYYYGSLLKKLITEYMINRLSTNINNNNKIFISIFYVKYISLIEDNIYIKYKKKLSDFKNYNELYIFLKEKGYVDKYYNYYVIKMKKNYKKFYNKYFNDFIYDKELINYTLSFKKKIKNFKDIDLIKVIDKYIDNNFNKEYIKNKFIELIKKYNI